MVTGAFCAQTVTMNRSHGPELFGSTFRRGEIVFRQGAPGDVMYIIQSGAVEVSQSQNGRDTVIAILEKGDFFGEMALLQNDVRSATVTAISHTRLIPLTKTLLVERLKCDSDVSLHLLRKLIQRLQRAHHRYQKALRENEMFRNAIATRKTLSDECQENTPEAGTDALRNGADLVNDLLLAHIDSGNEHFRHHAAEGEAIFHEGDTGDCMYLVLRGTVGISKHATHDACFIDTIGPGDFFGEMALITNMPRSATVTALEPADLIAIDKQRFLDGIHTNPRLIVALIKTLILRLSCLEAMLADPGHARVPQRSVWIPKLVKRNRVSISFVSLSTCAGCSAVLLDQPLLAKILSKASIDYCQMLMDRETLPQSEIIVVDGVVRLKEDQMRLEEARRKCRYLVAWGTCAAFTGIPGLANRFEVETVIEESYGATDDAFSYYLSGSSGMLRGDADAINRIELHRRAFAIDTFEKVDYYIPGCPPDPTMLCDLIEELTGGQPSKKAPVVCSKCNRRPVKGYPGSGSSSRLPVEHICFNSLGRICLGFMTRGGHDAMCPKGGLPCWGCRGPSKKTILDIKNGDTVDEIAARGIAQRRGVPVDDLRETIKKIKQSGHFMLNLESDGIEKLLRAR